MTANILRTVLSLLGIAVGIFSIISVYAVVDSLERSIRSSVQGLGSDVVYVQKWPWGGGGGEYEWWKYFQRPEVGYFDYQRLEEFGVRGSDAIVLLNGTTTTVSAGALALAGGEGEDGQDDDGESGLDGPGNGHGD